MAYLELINLHKSFGNIKAVNNFNLSIDKGKLVSFLGPSGCGKTTTLRMIAGFEQPDEGSILLDHEDITFIGPNKRDIGMVFQSYALFPNMTVFQNIAFGLKMRKTPKTEIEKRVNETLEMVRLSDTSKRYPHQLSGGQQQRIALARALAIRPRVLLLDEPLSALDAEVRLVLRGEIRRIQSELAMTTIYVTHDQEEALSISDKVVVMENGTIQQVGTPQEIYRAPQTRFVATFIGTANQFFGKVDGENKVVSNGLIIKTGKLSDFVKDQPVVVLVRPEMITVNTKIPEAKNENVVEGVVETITFHGAVTRLGVHVNQQRVAADIIMNSSESISLNQKIWLSFKPEICKVMAVDK